MIIKQRTKPVMIDVDEGLLRRLPLNHRKRKKVADDLAIRQVGFQGEEAIDYYLDKLPKQHLHIFNDIRIKNRKYHFQMDTLLLTPSFALIIEIKSLVGTLIFDTNTKQFIRVYHGVEEGFQDPIMQVEEQREQLIDWLCNYQLDSLPIEYVVGISNPATIIKANPGSEHIYDFVLHFDYLKQKYLELKKKYPEPQLDNQQIKLLGQQLIQSHTPLIEDIHTLYGISEHDIQRGVFCPVCKNRAMNKIYRKWRCPSCRFESTTAYQQAIIDYLLLISPTITNQQCREFLLLNDRRAATRLLTSSGLPFTGANKGRVYYRKD
ncbi:nuclease-related domain-containing protein [Aquibacillus rhizosphaerae]|uniref:Nuclease-related domain-containing protein n=1 Tax=Aquibacillus rhizosphaerae TaxID=3051431 RepID=A0ABT7L2V8_9BACI|nr:nuclease-related domain-containing protein [Aquibacillus sp. LR5S19]MDL4838941.1 nuclease-related domain-containing protein [Aquibacillus sp. LR5S19]